MDEEKYQAKDNQEALEEQKNQNTNTKAVKVAAKGVANYFTAGKGGAIVDVASKTKVGNAILNTGGAVVTKLNKVAPGGQILQKGLNKLDDSGAIDTADNAMDLVGTGGAKGAEAATKGANAGAEAATKAPEVTDVAGNANSLMPTNDTATSSESSTESPGKKKSFIKKAAIKKFAIPIGVFGFIIIFIIFIAIIGPNAGATMDLTSGSGAGDRASTEGTTYSEYTSEEIEALLVYVGDSRTVGMKQSLNNNIAFIGEVSMGYNYLTTTAISELDTLLASSNKKFIVFNFGVNDLGNIDKYINYYNSLKDKYKDKKIYFMSVNPVDENKEAANGYSVSNDNIESFNEKLSNAFGEDYIDIYYQIITSLDSTDGVHYSSEQYKIIHDKTVEYIKSKNKIANGGSGSLTSLDYYPTKDESEVLNGTSLKSLIGDDGINELNSYINSYIEQGGKCTGESVAGAAIGLINGLHQKGYHLPYYYGGGHGANNGVDANWGATIGASIPTPHGNVYYISGLDCSGFVSWAMNTSGIPGTFVASSFLGLGASIQMSEASAGDVLANDGHVIMVIENKGDYLQTAESTGGGVQFTTKTASQITNYKLVDMDGYYLSHCSK